MCYRRAWLLVDRALHDFRKRCGLPWRMDGRADSTRFTWTVTTWGVRPSLRRAEWPEARLQKWFGVWPFRAQAPVPLVLDCLAVRVLRRAQFCRDCLRSVRMDVAESAQLTLGSPPTSTMDSATRQRTPDPSPATPHKSHTPTAT